MTVNKNMIEKLQKYFMKQDKSILARLLANQMIDIYRVYIFDSLSSEGRKCLLKRIELNCEALENFVKDEYEKPLTFGPLDMESER
jgi:hypothetical protein